MISPSTPHAPWDPGCYLAFAGPRQQPAVDLLNRISDATPARVADLGCGPGTITRLLRQRWPAAEIWGVDSDPAMLSRAAAEDATIHWQAADAASWQPPGPLDVLFSNAALHWVDDHPTLFSRLLATLAPDGCLAVQMPDNFAAPSHRAIRELAAREPFASPLQASGARMGAVLAPQDYLAIIEGAGARATVWQTEYWQVLAGDQAVLVWLEGSTLVPYRAALGPELYGEFRALLAARLAEAYPVDAGGRTLFPFRRLFLVGRR